MTPREKVEARLAMLRARLDQVNAEIAEIDRQLWIRWMNRVAR